MLTFQNHFAYNGNPPPWRQKGSKPVLTNSYGVHQSGFEPLCRGQSSQGFTPPDGTPFFKGFARQKGPQSVRYAHTKSCVITCFYCLTSFASLGVPPRRCLTRKPLKQENIPVCELRYSLVLMVRCPSESIVFPLCFPATMLIRCIIGATTNTDCYVNL